MHAWHALLPCMVLLTTPTHAHSPTTIVVMTTPQDLPTGGLATHHNLFNTDLAKPRNLLGNDLTTPINLPITGLTTPRNLPDTDLTTPINLPIIGLATPRNLPDTDLTTPTMTESRSSKVRLMHDIDARLMMQHRSSPHVSVNVTGLSVNTDS